jgi:hypothetical protein
MGGAAYGDWISGVFRDRFPVDKLWHRNRADGWGMHYMDFVQRAVNKIETINDAIDSE